MKFESYASIYENIIFVPDDITKIFIDNDLCVSGCFGSSFSGILFESLISSITNTSLYINQNKYSVKQLYNKLCKFIEIHQEKLQKDQEEKKEIDIRNYVKHYERCPHNYYTCTLDELIDLKRFFEICVENELFIIRK